jgi:PAS domain S-box-containing protein
LVGLAQRRESARTQLRVLIVEDSDNDALLLLRELKRGGYEPEYERVETPEAMKTALAGSDWDVIVSDYRLPRFGAPEALQVAQEAGSGAPFVVVSGKVGEDAAVDMMRAGAHDYVMKDNLARLCATVARGLEEAEKRRKLRRAERELTRRDAILEAVGFAAERFLGDAAGWEENIESVLEHLGVAAGTSRAYIFENYEGEDGQVWATQRYEWAARGTSAQIDNHVLKAIPYRDAGFVRWEETLGRGDPVYGNTADFPESEWPEMRAEEILSIVVVPIFVEGRWWGFMGFDECSVEREWSAAEVDALKVAASTLGAALRRRRIEEDLRQSEERYRAVIEQATDGIFLLDADTRRVVESNPAFQRMFGYSAEGLRGTEIYDLVAHPRENVDATIERTLQQRRRVVGERKYRRKGGSLLDVEVGVSVISLAGRDVICTIVRDVTERKRAEEALTRSESRLRTIIETEPECVKVLGMDGSLLEMNPAGLSMLEAGSLEQVRGKPVYEYIAPEHRADFVALTKKVLRGGSGMLEFELVGLKGTRSWLETHAVPLRDAQGEISGLLGITRDITERRRAEEALRQSEWLYRTVIEQARENIFLVDVQTRRIVEFNPAFRAALGYSREELHRMTLYDVVAHDRASVDENIRRVTERRDPSVGERKYRRKDGSLLAMEVSASIILRDGRETLCAVAHDVTERARAQVLLEQRVAALSRISAELTLDSPTESTLDTLAESVVSASTAVACSVALVDEEAGTVFVAGSHGLPEGYVDGLQAAYRSGVASPTIVAFRERRPVLVRDARRLALEDPLYAPVHRFVREAPWDSALFVPLVFRGKALGGINFAYLPGQEPGEDEQVFLRAVADQAAVVVENARLFSEARGKAALEERQRLARELHDSVSQALYGIALGANTALELAEHNPKRVADPIEYVLSLAEAGLAEMRALIFELRPESLETEGLVAALEKQAAALRARHEIGVKIVLCREPEASLEAKEAVYRIAQEALHNTVKHARATNVEVKMVCDPGLMTIEVSDDGVGFDPEGDFPGHLGLRSMRERALRLGGALEVESRLGGGSRIRARIPIR